MADIELNVPMQSDMVFRIGSITKQFTAVCILQLMEQGKLGLQDEITKFIPDYPTQAHKITIEHLLTHTSGIMSYTGMKNFQDIIRKDMKPEEIIDFFKNQPMEFAPGSKWNYNNSGYFLLGYIIEKVSGKTYPQYLEENIFKPLGMTNSFYGSNNKIIRNRASGYQPANEGTVNADIMSMTIQNKLKDIAILKAQGFAAQDIRQIFLTESITIGVMGAFTGLLLGFILSSMVYSLPFPKNDFISITHFPVVFHVKHYAFGVGFGIITTLFAGLMPAMRAGKIDPVEILRG